MPDSPRPGLLTERFFSRTSLFSPHVYSQPQASTALTEESVVSLSGLSTCLPLAAQVLPQKTSPLDLGGSDSGGPTTFED